MDSTRAEHVLDAWVTDRSRARGSEKFVPLSSVSSADMNLERARNVGLSRPGDRVTVSER